MRGVAFIAAALVAVSVAGAARKETALHGFVTKGLLTPVCRPDTPCEGPAAGVTILFSHVGGQVFRTVTRPTGFYRLALLPGRYQIRVRGPALGQAHLSPKRVRVVGGTDGRLDFYVDTGLQ